MYSFGSTHLRKLRAVFFLVLLLFPFIGRTAVQPRYVSSKAEQWADSVLQSLSPAERIGQLFMVAAFSNKDSVHIREIISLVNEWKIGGLIFFQGGPVRQALLTNYYQSQSKVPLMIGIDGEWGLSMRLDSTIRYPRQMTLSAIPDDSAVYRMGKAVADDCRRLGIHINFAPDADINNNVLNPIIGSRSFGDNREQVFRKSLLYMNGLLDNGVLACGKHFPGHGNADSDSHLTLPTINQPKSEMDTVELYPFRRLIDNGLSAMMVAHLNVPALDSTPNLPSTLSSKIVKELLQEELGFNGLIFTDALNMKGVSACYQPGILDRTALLAGNDILLYSEDVHKAVEEIMAAVDSGMITQAEIDRRVKKVLMAKYWCGLDHYTPIDTASLIADLNSPGAKQLQQELYEKSVTVLTNQKEILPLKFTPDLRVASVSIGKPKENTFQQTLHDHFRIDQYAEEKDASADVFKALFEFLKNYDLVVLSLHGTTMRASNGFGISENAALFIDSVMATYPTVFVDFGNAYTLTRFRRLEKAKAVVLAYEDFPLTQQLAAQTIVGAATTAARLPVSVNSEFVNGSGINQPTEIRLKQGLPEAVGISSQLLLPIDSIVENAIRNGAMPGCQVLVAKDGVVIFNKSYGYHTYDSLQKVTSEDSYDIASVTKIAATALATMAVFDKGNLELNAPLSKYLPKLRSSNKRSMIVREMLAHQSGLPAWIPFWKQLVDSSGNLKSMFAVTKSKEFSVRICDSLYMKKEYSDSLQQWVFKSPMSERGKYVYSDLGPIMMKWAIERITDQSFDQFLEKTYYAPLQLGHTAFQPYQKIPMDHLVPTANDKDFRKRLLQGDVHDPAAAMQDGISGNAGLFSNAFDLAVIMQMMLNKGTYGGVRFLKPNTVSLFTRQQFLQNKNRRGLLFDRPETEPGKSSPCCASASPETFGHQGFTGTCVWADPKYNLIYVFLSNRVHPDESNDKLIKMNVRTSIQQVIYDAVLAR